MLKKACQRFGLTKANLRNIRKNAWRVLLRIMFPPDASREHPVRELWYWLISFDIAFWVSITVAYAWGYNLLPEGLGNLVSYAVFVFLLFGMRWAIFLVSRPITRAIKHIWNAIPEGEHENR